jgi:hypothetical protein
LSGAARYPAGARPSKCIIIIIIVIDKEEKVFAFGRFSIHACASLHDFWPKLVERCSSSIGNPEDHEIWHDRRKLDKILLDHQKSWHKGFSEKNAASRPEGRRGAFTKESSIATRTWERATAPDGVCDLSTSG